MTAPTPAREALAAEIERLVEDLAEQQAMPDDWWRSKLTRIIAAFRLPADAGPGVEEIARKTERERCALVLLNRAELFERTATKSLYDATKREMTSSARLLRTMATTLSTRPAPASEVREPRLLDYIARLEGDVSAAQRSASAFCDRALIAEARAEAAEAREAAKDKRIAELEAGLRLYASADAWLLDRECDPNGSNFSGQSYARSLLPESAS